MADKVTVKVEGVEKAISELKKYQVIKRQAIKDILAEVGFKIEGDAKREVRVDTGRLRASVSTGISGKLGHSDKDKVDQPSGERGMVVVVGTNVEYAPYQEFGTRKMSGKPYLYPAYHKNEGEALKRISKVMKKKV